MTKSEKINKQFLLEISGLFSVSPDQIDTNYVYPGGSRQLSAHDLGNGFWMQVEYPVAQNPYGAADSYAIKTQAVKDPGSKKLSDVSISDKDKTTDITQVNKNAEMLYSKELEKQIKKFNKNAHKLAKIKSAQKLIDDIKKVNIKFSKVLNKIKVKQVKQSKG